MLKAYSNETDTVIAESPEDATAIEVELTGNKPEDLDTDWRELRPEVVLSIVNEGNHTEATSRTVAEWIALEGRGLLCSTEW